MNLQELDRMHELIKARQFELSALLPISWKSVALRLKRAADKLYDHYHAATIRIMEKARIEFQIAHEAGVARQLQGDELEDALDSDLIGVYFLLMGYAFENVLKALLLHEHPEYFKPKSKMSDIQDHDLVRLCGRCKVELQPEEASLLQKLTRYIVWQGKYPIPLEAQKMWPLKQADGAWKDGGEAFHGRQTQQELDSLFFRLYAELEHRQHI